MKIHKADKFTFNELFELAKPEMDAICNAFSLPAIEKVLNAEINGYSTTECIYGKLTGSCESEETKQFIKTHITDVIEINRNNPIYIGYRKEVSFEESLDQNRAAYFQTPLEQYIFPIRQEEDWYYDTNEEEWPESYTERIEKVKTYIKSKINAG